MTPKFIDHMRVAIVGRVPAQLEFASVSFDVQPAATMHAVTCNYKYRATCELSFDQVAPPGAEDNVRQKAVASFTHHIYGEIRNELFEVLQDVRKGNSDAARLKVEALLDGLT
jgi:hypothetical protein